MGTITYSEPEVIAQIKNGHLGVNFFEDVSIPIYKGFFTPLHEGSLYNM